MSTTKKMHIRSKRHSVLVVISVALVASGWVGDFVTGTAMLAAAHGGGAVGMEVRWHMCACKKKRGSVCMKMQRRSLTESIDRSTFLSCAFSLNTRRACKLHNIHACGLMILCCCKDNILSATR